MLDLLALDPGLTATGLVLFSEGKPVRAETLRPPKSLGDWRARVSRITERVAEIMAEEHPLTLAIEEGFVPPYRPARPEVPAHLGLDIGGGDRRKTSSDQGKAALALRTAELRGCLANLADGTDCEVVGVTPYEAQRALTGETRRLRRAARKALMVRWARMRYPDLKWTQDSADACGIGLAALRKLRERDLREQALLPEVTP